MMIGGKKDTRVLKEGTLSAKICGKDIGIYSIFCQFRVHKTCNGITITITPRDEIESRTFTSQRTDTTQQWPDIELNGQSFELEDTFCYLGDTIEAR